MGRSSSRLAGLGWCLLQKISETCWNTKYRTEQSTFAFSSNMNLQLPAARYCWKRKTRHCLLPQTSSLQGKRIRQLGCDHRLDFWGSNLDHIWSRLSLSQIIMIGRHQELFGLTLHWCDQALLIWGQPVQEPDYCASVIIATDRQTQRFLLVYFSATIPLKCRLLLSGTTSFHSLFLRSLSYLACTKREDTLSPLRTMEQMVSFICIQPSKLD